MTEIEKHIAEAKKLGLESRDMLDNLDGQANLLGTRLAKAIMNGNDSWNEEIEKIALEAHRMRIYRTRVLAALIKEAKAA